MTLSQSLGDQIHDELVLLAPAWSHIPESFTRRCVDRNKHARWLSAAQRVRGGVYLADGAVQASDLTADGRHVQRSDYDSWHLLAVAANGEVQGCARYRHLTGNVGFDDLGVRESWLARCGQWGPTLRAAVESEIVRAKQRGAAFSEVGGWAIWEAAWASAQLPNATVPRRSCAGLGAARWSTAGLNCLRITTLNTGAGWKSSDSIRARRLSGAGNWWNK